MYVWFTGPVTAATSGIGYPDGRGGYDPVRYKNNTAIGTITTSAVTFNEALGIR